MSENPSPTDSAFATAEEAEAYEHWFRMKVQKSLDDQRPTAAHEDVMAALRKIIEVKHDINASDPMAS
jgi:hypothetical protein